MNENADSQSQISEDWKDIVTETSNIESCITSLFTFLDNYLNVFITTIMMLYIPSFHLKGKG